MSYEEDIQYKGIDLVEMESKICFIILLNVIILNGRRSMAEYLDLERNMKNLINEYWNEGSFET